MKRSFLSLFFVAAVLAASPALADYPTDCKGPGEPSGSDCMGASYEGCCDDAGRVIWCDGGQLFCIDCAGLNPQCGWQGEFYDCGTDGSADPSGANPLDCVSCDPPCEAGKVCKDGVCVVCTPDCAGKQCGNDGCGGKCGECTGQCVDGLCHQGPGCEPSETTGCGGCKCEECTCALDTYCCDTAWDKICVDECIADCGGCAVIESCGNAVCDGIETCANCPEDCSCADGVCFQGKCCKPFCGGKNCGDDMCGGSCGECAETDKCTGGVCITMATGPGCVAVEGVKGCNGCDCETCVCEMDAYCCDTAWDAVCVEECISCGSCMPPATCGNQLCEPGENCGDCAGDCPCAPNWACEEKVCVDKGCVPDCADKECGDDGCGGQCGVCAEGFECTAGKCTEKCVADCTGKVCGDDGCGGSCGVCAATMKCDDEGQCVELVSSCENLCNGGADTCFCDDLCFENGDCCEDVCEFCGDLEGCNTCTPDCTDKVCGDDGCEGSCGECDEGFLCEAGLCIEETPVCVPDCTDKVCGDDGCEGSCGECNAGSTCTEGKCVEDLPVCVPDCAGKECGDDGCGGVCGECGEGLVCGEGVCEEEEGEEPTETKSSGGCSTTDAGALPSALVLMLALMGLAVARRRVTGC